MGSKGVGVAAAAGGFVGLFVGIGLARLVTGHAGQRSSAGATIMMALAAAGASAGAGTGGFLASKHLALPAQATT